MRRTYRRYAASPAVTALREFPGRTHWLLAQDGWQEIAESIAAWLESPAATAWDAGGHQLAGFAWGDHSDGGRTAKGL